jgi:ring-1,2-phenylacetyl-CoA epoxidase subunit PaaC
MSPRLTFLLRLADAPLILGQRLSAWCGHGPILEEDVAMANIALDLLGQARLLLAHAAEVEGRGRTDDDLAFSRDVLDFHNPLLVEQPNGDFADTMVRQLLFDAWQVPLLAALKGSTDAAVAAIADKAHKEARYHLEHSAGWVVRLGDGTDESHRRTQAAVDRLWRFTGELFAMDAVDGEALDAGWGIDATALRPPWDRTVDAVLTEATLRRPEDGWMHEGGRRGEHTEHLGHLLSEMQFMQRAYPGATW